MRLLSTLLIVPACLAASAAIARDAPYYGPVKAWGIGGFGREGYKERTEPDGSWRIDAATRGRDATEMALYRAAERASVEGYAYVEMLGGRATTAPGRSTATLYARPTRTPGAPAVCWLREKPKSCYTADVAEVLRRLSGPNGDQPGVPRPGQTDEHGRQVSYGGIDFGFGVGAVSRTPALPAVAAPAAPRPVAQVVPIPITAHGTMPARVTAAQRAADRFAAARRSVTPVRSDKAQGWTIGD